VVLLGAKPGLSSVAKETAERLDALDARRNGLRSVKPPLTAATVTAVHP
jgi:hypothetical protein